MSLRNTWRSPRRLVGLVVVALMVSACGGTDAADEPSSSSPISVPLTATPTSTAPGTDDPAGTAPSSTAPQGTPAPLLAGTRWNVTNYDQGSAITNVWKTEITISFASDGTVSGSGGCNTYQGSWETEGPYLEFEDRGSEGNYGQAIRLDGLVWTEIACESEDIMVQEGEYIDLLQRAGRWRISEGEFTLHDSDSRVLFYAEPLS